MHAECAIDGACKAVALTDALIDLLAIARGLYLLNFAGGCVSAGSPTSAFRSSQREKQPSPSAACTSDSSARARSLHMRAMSVATHIG